MKWDYKGGDVAYLKFREVKEGGVKESMEVVNSGLVLDFDHQDRLVGIETISASEDLPKEILQSFSEKGDEDKSS